MKPVTIGIVHFQTCQVLHFERAWWTVQWQSRIGELVDQILIYDNNSGSDPRTLHRLIADRPTGVPVSIVVDAHGDPSRTHPYSVNRVVERVQTPWLLLTRSDYLLAPDALVTLMSEADRTEQAGFRPFVSGWCYQSAYDRQQRDLPPFDLDTLPWRTTFSVLVDGRVPGFCFYETDQDAGVWLTRVSYLREAGPMNEQLSAWGYSQSTYQRVLRARAGVTCVAVPRYVCFHQQHGIWPRDFAVARAQYNQFGAGQ